MARKLLVTLGLLLLTHSAAAVRVIEQVERPVELTLAELNLPAAGGTTISFSACPTCSTSTHRLLDTTVLKVNGQTVPLQEFIRLADEIGDKPNGAENAIAVVFLDLATERITRIEVRE
ncbi:MAG TPA: hypothetical protein VM692_12085 [Gammaproteobacteria bacterium]|nr:hypothetical protein [Gammaproteobacteria bacterium]